MIRIIIFAILLGIILTGSPKILAQESTNPDFAAIVQDDTGSTLLINETSSPNFILVGAIEQNKAQSLIRELEVFRSGVLDIFDGPSDVEDEKIKIFYINDSDLFDELAPFKGAAAFYWDTVLGPQILINGALYENGEQELKHSLFHEYLHHLNARHLGYNIPIWYNEGLAEYYATFELTSDGKYIVGQSLPIYFESLNDEGWIPLVTLIDALHEYPHLNNIYLSSAASHLQQSYFYSQSWLITHYLKNMPDGMIKTRQFINSLDPRENSETSFKAIFGMGYLEFEDQLKEYVKDGDIPFDVIEPTRKQYDGPLSSRSLPTKTYNEQIYRLAVQATSTPTLGLKKDAIRAELTAQGRLNASLYASDAISALMDDEMEQATDRLRQALKLDPTDNDIQTLSAMVDVYQMNGTPISKLRPLRSKIRKAVANNVGDMTLQSMLVLTYPPMSKSRVDTEVVTILDKLMNARIEVSNPEVSLSLIDHLLELERYDDVDRILNVVEIWGRHTMYRSRARRLKIEAQAHRLANQ